MLTQILIFSTAVEGVRNTTDLNFIIMRGKSPRELQMHKNPVSTACLAWVPSCRALRVRARGSSEAAQSPGPGLEHA